MADLTEEEYDALDEYYTKNPPQIDPTKKGTGFFTRRTLKARTITVERQHRKDTGRHNSR